MIHFLARWLLPLIGFRHQGSLEAYLREVSPTPPRYDDRILAEWRSRALPLHDRKIEIGSLVRFDVQGNPLPMPAFRYQDASPLHEFLTLTHDAEGLIAIYRLTPAEVDRFFEIWDAQTAASTNGAAPPAGFFHQRTLYRRMAFYPGVLVVNMGISIPFINAHVGAVLRVTPDHLLTTDGIIVGKRRYTPTSRLPQDVYDELTRFAEVLRDEIRLRVDDTLLQLNTVQVMPEVVVAIFRPISDG